VNAPLMKRSCVQDQTSSKS